MAFGEKTLRIRYVGDTSGVSKALGAVDKQHQTFGSKLKSMGKSLVGSFFNPMILGTVGIGVALNEAGEAAKAFEQTKAVLKSTGGAANVTEADVAALSERLGDLAVVDDDLVRSGANVLLTFTSIRNEVGKGNDIFDQAAEAALNVSTAMGRDLSSSAVMVGKALNNPILGLTSLTRVGVQFTDQQRKMIERLVESGDVMGAQKIILQELQTEFGGSAAAAGKAATPVQKLTKLGLDLAEKVGKVLIPILELLVPVLSFVVEKAIVPVLNALQKVIGFVAQKAGPVLKKLGEVFGAVFRGIRDVVGAVFGWIGEKIAWVIDKIRGLIQWLQDAWEWIKKVFENPAGANAAIGGSRIIPAGGRAMGGPVSAGRSFLVGERGPELFTPSSNGRIIPNGGLGGVTVVVNVAGSVVAERDLVESVRREVQRVARRNAGRSGF